MTEDNLAQLSGTCGIDRVRRASADHTVRKGSVAILCRRICSELDQDFGDLCKRKVQGGRGSGYLVRAAADTAHGTILERSRCTDFTKS